MDNNEGHDTTYYKASGNEHKGKQLTQLQGEVLAYILKNTIVSCKSIQLYWYIDEITLIVTLQALIDHGLVVKVPTKKQAEELQLLNSEKILTEDEERHAIIQEKTTEIQYLDEEYSRKQREMNRIYEKREKVKQELSELTKADYQFHHVLSQEGN